MTEQRTSDLWLSVAEFIIRGLLGAVAVIGLLWFAFYSAAHPEWIGCG